jgi:hypothetical protein
MASHSPSRIAAIPLLGIALSLAAADARAATYVAQPAGGGRVELEATRGKLLRAEASLPARCENNHGGSWDGNLVLDLSGELALRRGGRFAIEGQAANGVRYELRGRRRSGAYTGRIWLTYLDIDHVGVDDSYLCDTGRLRYRAVKQER